LYSYPNNFTIHYNLGKCYEQKDDYYNANRYYSKALDLKPDNTQARIDRMSYSFEKKYWTNAIEDLNQLILSTGFFDQNYYFKRAYCYQELGNKDAALSDYNAVIKENPKYSYALNNRGVIYMSNRSYQLALNDFSNAVKSTYQTDTEGLKLFYENKANALYNLNRKSEACADWKKALSYGSTSAAQRIRSYCK
jgi:tetratricopeptide (TPR) repeat protein